MNHHAILSFILFLFCVVQACLGSPGCMSYNIRGKDHVSRTYATLQHVTDTVDPENPNAGYCKCDCTKHIAKYGKSFPHNQCPVCKHIHIPQTSHILTHAHQEYKNYVREHAQQIEQHPYKKLRKTKKLATAKKSNELFKNLTFNQTEK